MESALSCIILDEMKSSLYIAYPKFWYKLSSKHYGFCFKNGWSYLFFLDYYLYKMELIQRNDSI